ncbi:hypothetical protein SBA4_2400007 [Candidatus Sulfopaludibacter sp. SbA4]|nr:hypothetical protein SBA4_2400007 [Candidatus Sulfopaludibacter sp. SbA4]
MPPNRIDLSAGSVLHIRGFSSRGHPPKDKYIFIIGQKSDSEALGFLISSQLAYLRQEVYKNEVVKVPHNSTTFLRFESIIQCFTMERLSVTALCEGFENGSIGNAGKMPVRYLHRIREVG